MARAPMRLWIPQALREAGRPLTVAEIAEALHRNYLNEVPLRRIASRVRVWLAKYRGKFGVRHVCYGFYAADGAPSTSAEWRPASRPPSEREAAPRDQGRSRARVEVTPAALERAQRDLVLTLPADLSERAELLLHLAQACLAGYAALRQHVHDDEQENEDRQEDW